MRDWDSKHLSEATNQLMEATVHLSLNVLLTPLVILPKAGTVEWPGTHSLGLSSQLFKTIYLFIWLCQVS